MTHFRYLGDKFNLDGAECICTQDRMVNNRLGIFNVPSLCGESGGKFVVVVVVVVVSNFVLCVLPICL